jgi:signal transduction histidine kinase
MRLTLKLKIFFSLGIFYLAALGILTYLTIRSHRSLLIAQMDERARSGINLIELSITGPLYKLNITQLNTVAREAKALPDVEYAYVYDAEGRIVGDFHETEEKLHSVFTDEVSQRIIKSKVPLIDIDYEKGILDISKPVILGNQKLGGIRLGFNLNPTLDEMKQVTMRDLGISTVIFLLGLLFIFGIAERMTKPIQELTIGAKRIEEGDLQYRVALKRSDELGSLALAFNQMAERLMHRERELKQSQSIIRRADRLSSLGQLTAGLAHEIRNPLVAIRTFTQLLPERYQDTEFRNGFQSVALKEVDRICGLVSNLLSFARPTTPNVAAENINEIVESIARILETEAKENDVRIDLRLSAGLPKIFIDKEQIKQVCMNIILNAIQSIEGERIVGISTRPLGGNGAEDFVQIEVRDTGVGIPEKDLENIFNPFFTTKREGNGLGLSISHQIVQEHGGYILVESKPGKGTTFFINLPVRHLTHQGAKARPQLHEEDSGRR